MALISVRKGFKRFFRHNLICHTYAPIRTPWENGFVVYKHSYHICNVELWLTGVWKNAHRQRPAGEAQQGQNSFSRLPDTCPVVRMGTVSLFQNSQFYQSGFLSERSYLEKIWIIRRRTLSCFAKYYATLLSVVGGYATQPRSHECEFRFLFTQNAVVDPDLLGNLTSVMTKTYAVRSPSNGASISINFLSQPFPE